jgi:hypothetical protein
MKVEYLVAALVCAIILLAGCITPPPGNVTETPTPEIGPSPEINETPQPEVQPFAAKEKLVDARAGITWLRPDAELVGVQGSCEGDGKSVQWAYQFDSIAAGTGYMITIPGGAASYRETAFSFRRPLGGQFVDSTQAASACGTGSGEFSLEVVGGTPVWTVISGSTVCEVNATSGQRIAGD